MLVCTPFISVNRALFKSLLQPLLSREVQPLLSEENMGVQCTVSNLWLDTYGEKGDGVPN